MSASLPEARRELADFLRTRRARLSPEEVGFPTGSRRRTPGLRREEVAQLAAVSPSLYTWLEQTFPVRQDPRHQSGVASWVGPRDSVAHLRDGILRRLVNTGTEAAVEALQNVLRQLPDRDWLAYQLLEAEQTMRKRT